MSVESLSLGNFSDPSNAGYEIIDSKNRKRPRYIDVIYETIELAEAGKEDLLRGYPEDNEWFKRLVVRGVQKPNWKRSKYMRVQ